jgi:rubrerythrin
MVALMETTAETRQLHLSGIHHAIIPADEEDILSAYVQYAFHHTNNDVEMYENAATLAPLIEQKQLFLQLACRKREILLKLKMSLPVSSPMMKENSKKAPGSSLTRYILDLDSTPLLTIEDAFNLAYWRENKTTLLYENLLSSLTHHSTRMLFDFLLAEQRDCIDFITRSISEGCIGFSAIDAAA